jgi:uncharacterized protein YbjT (DUF2867 family)
MNVLVAGGHGKVGLRLLKLLAARGDVARGLIRNPAHAAELEAIGAQPVIDDLESESEAELGRAVEGSDAVVFAAGAGPGSGAARKRTVDLGGALKLIEACHQVGVRRYVIVSAIGVGRPGGYPPEMEPYYEAKREADEALQTSGLEHTIVRPGRLTDDPGTGLIEVGMPLDHGGEVTRDDVAATLVAVLDQAHTIGLAFDLINGTVPVDDAVAPLFPEPGG